MNYEFYCCDCETLGLDPVKYDIIELSILRMKDNVQKTWFIQPTNPNNYEPIALKVNGHKLEDLQHKTKYGRETYKDPKKVIIEIENWLAEDMAPSESRFLIGQNITFDKTMMEYLWEKCGSKDSFPFGRRFIDTMVIELFLDYCKGEFADSYSLNSIIKKYGVKNDKAHTAAADTKATSELFLKQADVFSKLLK